MSIYAPCPRGGGRIYTETLMHNAKIQQFINMLDLDLYPWQERLIMTYLEKLDRPEPIKIHNGKRFCPNCGNHLTEYSIANQCIRCKQKLTDPEKPKKKGNNRYGRTKDPKYNELSKRRQRYFLDEHHV